MSFYLVTCYRHILLLFARSFQSHVLVKFARLLGPIYLEVNRVSAGRVCSCGFCGTSWSAWYLPCQEDKEIKVIGDIHVIRVSKLCFFSQSAQLLVNQCLNILFIQTNKVYYLQMLGYWNTQNRSSVQQSQTLTTQYASLLDVRRKQ